MIARQLNGSTPNGVESRWGQYQDDLDGGRSGPLRAPTHVAASVAASPASDKGLYAGYAPTLPKFGTRIMRLAPSPGAIIPRARLRWLAGSARGGP